MFNTEIKKISGVLVGALIMWLFAQTLLISPLVVAVDKLSTTIDNADTRNTTEHGLIVRRLQAQQLDIFSNKSRMHKNEVKLFRVLTDCRDNVISIEDCKSKLLIQNLKKGKVWTPKN